MPTAVRPRVSSSYSSSSKYSSQFPSKDHQSEMPLRSSSPGRHRNRTKSVSLPQPKGQVQMSPRRRRNEHQATGETPIWLKVLIAVQRGSTPITFFLVVGVLIMYGWSVYTQRAWSKAYSQLAQLQREERHLTATSEARKYQLAQQAESARTGLVRRDPASVIFLEPEPPRSVNSNSDQPTKEFTPIFPVGY